jgi:hypothetical protein
MINTTFGRCAPTAAAAVATVVEGKAGTDSHATITAVVSNNDVLLCGHRNRSRASDICVRIRRARTETSDGVTLIDRLWLI